MKFEWHRLCVNLMKRARRKGGPWSDLEWELSGRNRNFEAWLNVMSESLCERIVYFDDNECLGCEDWWHCDTQGDEDCYLREEFEPDEWDEELEDEEKFNGTADDASDDD